MSPSFSLIWILQLHFFFFNLAFLVSTHLPKHCITEVDGDAPHLTSNLKWFTCTRQKTTHVRWDEAYLKDHLPVPCSLHKVIRFPSWRNLHSFISLFIGLFLQIGYVSIKISWFHRVQTSATKSPSPSTPVKGSIHIVVKERWSDWPTS